MPSAEDACVGVGCGHPSRLVQVLFCAWYTDSLWKMPLQVGDLGFYLSSATHKLYSFEIKIKEKLMKTDRTFLVVQ